MIANPSDTDYNRPVIVLPYDPSWLEEFQKICDHLWPAIQHITDRIEHVGSTAVPGLAAKPVIDLDVVISRNQLFPAVKAALESLGYWHIGDQGILGREAFKYDPDKKPNLMRHHLYVCAADSAELKRHLALRDHLRAHPVDRDAYAAVKFAAAQAHPDDIDGYIEAKSPFIRAILDQYKLNDSLSVLANTYAMQPQKFEKVEGGWSAQGYRIDTNEGVFFLKIYDKSHPRVSSFVPDMIAHLPVLRFLNLDPLLSTHLPELVLTHNGSLFTEDKDHVYVLYRFIDGQTIGSGELTESEVDQLADVLARLHTYHAYQMPDYRLPTKNYYFDLEAQLHALRVDRRQELPSDLLEAFGNNKALIDQALNKLSQLADQLRPTNQDFCLVHGDPHNWNVIRSGSRLILVDWEDLRFSLPEQDLMYLVDTPYYQRFMNRYNLHHPEFKTNMPLVQFCSLRRDLTDIVQFTKQIVYENLDESIRAVAMSCIAENFKNLRKWLQR